MDKDDTRKRLAFTLNGKPVDLTDAVPLTIGDIRQLKKIGLDVLKFNTESMELDQIIGIIKYVCNKVDKGITETDVETMSLPLMNRLSTILYSSQGDELPF